MTLSTGMAHCRIESSMAAGVESEIYSGMADGQQPSLLRIEKQKLLILSSFLLFPTILTQPPDEKLLGKSTNVLLPLGLFGACVASTSSFVYLNISNVLKFFSFPCSSRNVLFCALQIRNNKFETFRLFPSTDFFCIDYKSWKGRIARKSFPAQKYVWKILNERHKRTLDLNNCTEMELLPWTMNGTNTKAYRAELLVSLSWKFNIERRINFRLPLLSVISRGIRIWRARDQHAPQVHFTSESKIFT